MDYGSDKKSAIKARNDAQKIAFGPVMFQAARALRNLGILETIRQSPEGISREQVAEKLDLSYYGVKVLLEAGLSIELVYVKEDKYFITKTGIFILSDTLTNVNMDFNHDVNYFGMFHLQEAVEKERPEGLKQVFGDWETIYHALSSLPEQVQKSWFAFDHYYSSVAFPKILPWIFANQPSHIFDVGGNTGKFALQCAEYDSNVPITIIDLPQQIELAKKNIKKHNHTAQIDYYPLNLLEHNKSFPGTADVIWMSQFLDCFSQEDIRQILVRSAQALNEGGALFILETYWDRQRFDGATYCLHGTSLYFTSMANGKSQMYHSEDIKKLIHQAGMKITQDTDHIGMGHTLFKCQLK